MLANVNIAAEKSALRLHNCRSHLHDNASLPPWIRAAPARLLINFGKILRLDESLRTAL
jgi:hypothetical protein